MDNEKPTCQQAFRVIGQDAFNYDIFVGLHTTHNSHGRVVCIVAPDMDTLRWAWGRLEAEEPFDDEVVHPIELRRHHGD